MIHRLTVSSILCLVVLTGCTSPDPSPTVLATDDSMTLKHPVPIPEGVVATGTLTSADGDELGPVEITHAGSEFAFDLPEYEFGPAEEIYIALSDSPFTLDECGDANIWQIGFPSDMSSVGALSEAYPDPSFFTSLLLVAPGREVPGSTCIQPILAVAALTWSIPDTHPWVEPVDSGAASGAQGTVDGEVYTTAPGDSWNAIAERFGISGSDLEWLNPIRTPGTPETAYEDQLLNLNPDDRSDSESRRPQ
jgi:hypothetical protein